MTPLAAMRNALPMLFAIAAGYTIWKWLWERWFAPGGEFIHGCIHLALLIGCLATLLREKRQAKGEQSPSFAFAALFLVAAAILYGRVPTLFVAALYASAIYWSYRSSAACLSGERTFALWPLLIVSLPVTPSLQFVFGYPLRSLAAKAATLILPGAVRAVGSGLGDGTVEVFVDAPCAGAGMLVSSLFLASGAALVFAFEWWRCGIMLIAGMACALSANAVRAAILYLGTSGRIAFPLHKYEELTGLFCFAASALILTLLAWFMAKRRKQSGRAGNAAVSSGCSGMRRKREAIFLLPCVALFAATAWTTERRPGPSEPLVAVVWPGTWNGMSIAPIEQSPETMRFWSGFPGRCQEFVVLDSGDTQDVPGDVFERIVMRFVTSPTRLLHPAEDCFRGTGYSITPQQARTDGHGRLWSGFTAIKNGRRHTVWQCVVSVGGYDLRDVEISENARSWPDVSSWYWEVAKPGSDTAPTALAITIINSPR